MGFGVTALAPCLADVLRVCSSVLFTIWVAPENRLAEVALRRSSVFTQDFRGPQMALRLGLLRTIQFTCVTRLELLSDGAFKLYIYLLSSRRPQDWAVMR